MPRRLAAGVTLNPTATEALAEATIRQTDTDEWTIQLDRQLERHDYEQLDAIFTRIAGGGRYQPKARRHRFGQDPTAEVAAVLTAGVMPPDPKLRDGWYATPVGVADNLAVNYACNGVDEIPHNLPFTLLEPSAGEGALVDAMVKFHQVEADNVTCVELDPYRAAVCRAKGYKTHTGRFEEWAASYTGPPFDLVVMNPPFSAPGNSDLWAEHVRLAWTLVGPGGSLTAIVARNYEYRRGWGDKNINAVRDLVDRYGTCYDHFDGFHFDREPFRESGYSGQPLILCLTRPAAEQPPMSLAAEEGRLF